MEASVLKKLEQNLRQLNSTSQGRRTFLKVMPFLVAGCAPVARTRHREGDNTGQETSISVADEKRMTQEYLPKMKEDYPPINDSWLQGYLTDLGNNIVNSNSLHQNPYEYNFTMVQTKAINAFALPAGTIFVTGPLLDLTENESELAGVVGHEIGHVKARHTAERIDKAEKSQLKTALLTIGGGLLGGVTGLALARIICSPEDRECLERIAKYGAMAGAAGGLLIQKYGFMANSREDEMEADRIGFRTSVAAGFSKDHVGGFFEKLLEMEDNSGKDQNKLMAALADAMSTHPPSEERVQQMRQMAKEESRTGTVSTKDYREAKRRIQKYLA